MTHGLTLAAAAAVAAAALSASATGANAQGAPAGRLSCHVGGAPGPVVTTQKPMECRFTPRRGPVQRYTGVVRSFSLDVNAIKRSTMAWRVFGPYARAPLGAVAGSFASTGGAGSQLIGGPEKDVTLQPLPLQGNRGFNVAAGVTALELSLTASRR